MSAELAQVSLDEATDKMGKAVTHTRAEFAGIRTGRAAPSLVEKIMVDYYGSEVPLQQLAGFQVPEARQLLITPYDKGAMGAIEKAIQHSDLGLNPSNDGVSIRLSFPPLTTERRKELVKVVRGMAEDGKVTLRNLRRAVRHELDSLEKDGELSSDELARAEKELDRIIHAQRGRDRPRAGSQGTRAPGGLMADDPRDDAEPRAAAPADPTEGVRIIKPDEAAEAVERGDAVKRRGERRAAYGDRPETPGGPRPSLRFPLADSSDPGLIVRPRVAPVEPRRETVASSRPDEDARPDPPTGDQPVLSVPTSGSVELPHWTDRPPARCPRS